jgi:hypothetical protein
MIGFELSIQNWQAYQENNEASTKEERPDVGAFSFGLEEIKLVNYISEEFYSDLLCALK